MSDTDITTPTCTKCGREVRKLRRLMCSKCYQAWRQASIDASTFQPFVDSEVVRAHICALIDAGIHQAEIARLSGVNRRRIRLIQNRQSDHSSIQPLSRVQRKTADRILSIPIPENQVPAIGTVRRVQALVTLGYPLFELAHRLRVTDGELANIALQRPALVQTDVAAAVADLYGALHMTPGPSADARKQARHYGWAAPLAWESTAALDDPAAAPDGVPPRPTHIVIPPDFADIVADHRALGHSDVEIAAAMNITIDALQKRYKKFGIDLAAVAS